MSVFLFQLQKHNKEKLLNVMHEIKNNNIDQRLGFLKSKKICNYDENIFERFVRVLAKFQNICYSINNFYVLE